MKKDDDLRLPTPFARFNTCFNDDFDDYGSAYTSFLHEVGHLIGISKHPEFPESVMNYDHATGVSDLLEPDCSPYPIDIMAVYALYQTGF